MTETWIECFRIYTAMTLFDRCYERRLDHRNTPRFVIARAYSHSSTAIPMITQRK